MLTNDNKLVTPLFCIGQTIAFTQCDDFVSIANQLVASLDERLLNCTLPFMLFGLQNTAFHLINGLIVYNLK